MRWAVALIILSALLLGAGDAQTQGSVLINQEVMVVRGDYKEMHFLMPDDLQGEWEIRGEFSSSGGLNDDITIRILNQQNYALWLSHYKNEHLVLMTKKKEGHFH